MLLLGFHGLRHYWFTRLFLFLFVFHLFYLYVLSCSFCILLSNVLVVQEFGNNVRFLFLGLRKYVRSIKDVLHGRLCFRLFFWFLSVWVLDGDVVECSFRVLLCLVSFCCLFNFSLIALIGILLLTVTVGRTLIAVRVPVRCHLHPLWDHNVDCFYCGLTVLHFLCRIFLWLLNWLFLFVVELKYTVLQLF